MGTTISARRARRYYAIEEVPLSSALSAEHRLAVHSFSTRRDRDAWVADSTIGDSHLLTRSARRRRASYTEAVDAIAEILSATWDDPGGRAWARESLREVYPEIVEG